MARISTGIAPQHEPYTQWPDTMVCEPADLPQVAHRAEVQRHGRMGDSVIVAIGAAVLGGLVLGQVIARIAAWWAA